MVPKSLSLFMVFSPNPNLFFYLHICIYPCVVLFLHQPNVHGYAHTHAGCYIYLINCFFNSILAKQQTMIIVMDRWSIHLVKSLNNLLIYFLFFIKIQRKKNENKKCKWFGWSSVLPYHVIIGLSKRRTCHNHGLLYSVGATTNQIIILFWWYKIFFFFLIIAIVNMIFGEVCI